MSLRSHKAEEIMLYLNFFAYWWDDPDPYKYWIRILEVLKQTDPMEHGQQPVTVVEPGIMAEDADKDVE